jgi:hypothetical protein
VRYADQRAAELGTSRSQIIGRALSELEARERDELGREGYLFYATESEDFAAVSGQAVSEALADASWAGDIYRVESDPGQRR